MGATDQSQVCGATAWPLRRAVGLARSCHPGPVVAVTSLATALAVSAGLGGARCALIGAAVLAGQLSVGWCNDAFDAQRDAAVGRRGKPVADGAVSRSAVWAAAFAALLLCVPLSLACGLLAGMVHLAAVVAAWLYNLKLKATALSWLPYVVGFGGLPAVVALSLPGHPRPAWWAVTAGALLGVAAHLGDVLPDIGDDLKTGLRGLPHRLGVTGTRLLLPVPLVAATAVLVLAPAGPPSAWGAATLAAAPLTALAGLALGRYWRKAALAGTVAVAAADLTLLLVRGTALA
ncbi:UbiA family prenyltransferase [Streptomyces lunaelactis]|uniref:UbiA family prenyltransferase n=1 Tax=Streptomyces lunaelactis TaxID=1535768 RepID=UPI0015846870|nr:UbiA family prenyltransferase [Streptomyces lunaelactis]NUK32401.1 UbiA family prenyltransferase [Streptomyces lunaelactis]NUK40501.1 UbiA family prenyltransferase [Streptomyces lunaelactis]NUK91495.1 UbiA family prenyltransferase [Streptomyces lunaelactis]NUL28377.1 UbiA family prenyltransferase [Streptomyces lunaelactis]